MTKAITMFPTQARFVATREERVELTNKLLGMIVKHLRSIPLQTEGNAHRDLRQTVESYFQGGSVVFGDYSYEGRDGETVHSRHTLLRFMWTFDPNASALGSDDAFGSLLGDSSVTRRSGSPNHAHTGFSPARFEEAIGLILACDNIEQRKHWQGGQATIEQRYDAAVKVWNWLKDIESISFYPDMGTNGKTGENFLWPWTCNDGISPKSEAGYFSSNFDAAKQGTKRIREARTVRPSEEANEASKVGADERRIFNAATGTWDLVEESSHDALDGAMPLSDLKRQLARETNKERKRLLTNLIG
tara:strand:- start:7554 stop:8462 length:909 start_codon:yes stop_codon:yes gene_type:complete